MAKGSKTVSSITPIKTMAVKKATAEKYRGSRKRFCFAKDFLGKRKSRLKSRRSFLLKRARSKSLALTWWRRRDASPQTSLLRCPCSSRIARQMTDELTRVLVLRIQKNDRQKGGHFFGGGAETRTLDLSHVKRAL